MQNLHSIDPSASPSLPASDSPTAHGTKIGTEQTEAHFAKLEPIPWPPSPLGACATTDAATARFRFANDWDLVGVKALDIVYATRSKTPPEMPRAWLEQLQTKLEPTLAPTRGVALFAELRKREAQRKAEIVVEKTVEDKRARFNVPNTSPTLRYGRIGCVVVSSDKLALMKALGMTMDGAVMNGLDGRFYAFIASCQGLLRVKNCHHLAPNVTTIPLHEVVSGLTRAQMMSGPTTKNDRLIAGLRELEIDARPITEDDLADETSPTFPALVAHLDATCDDLYRGILTGGDSGSGIVDITLEELTGQVKIKPRGPLMVALNIWIRGGGVNPERACAEMLKGVHRKSAELRDFAKNANADWARVFPWFNRDHLMAYVPAIVGGENALTSPGEFAPVLGIATANKLAKNDRKANKHFKLADEFVAERQNPEAFKGEDYVAWCRERDAVEDGDLQPTAYEMIKVAFEDRGYVKKNHTFPTGERVRAFVKTGIVAEAKRVTQKIAEMLTGSGEEA